MIAKIFKIIIDWFWEFSASFAADKLATSGKPATERAAVVIEAARKLAEIEQFDRPAFREELRIINADTSELKPILDLFDKFWKEKGVIFVGVGKERRSYRENQIGHLLQMIPIDQRPTEYVKLARLLKADPEKFYAQLEMLNNDRFSQIRRQFVAEIEDSELVKSIPTAASAVADSVKTLTDIGGPLPKFRDSMKDWARK